MIARIRVRLPAGPRPVGRSRLDVTVEDTSVADAPAEVVGRVRWEIEELPDGAVDLAVDVLVADRRRGSELQVAGQFRTSGDGPLRPGDLVTTQAVVLRVDGVTTELRLEALR